jgi:flavorubredoxin
MHNIAGIMAQLLAQTETESRNAAETVRATFDGTTRDVTDLIANAAMGLSQTSDQMRTSARAMVEEMESAREPNSSAAFSICRARFRRTPTRCAARSPTRSRR